MCFEAFELIQLEGLSLNCQYHPLFFVRFHKSRCWNFRGNIFISSDGLCYFSSQTYDQTRYTDKPYNIFGSGGIHRLVVDRSICIYYINLFTTKNLIIPDGDCGSSGDNLFDINCSLILRPFCCVFDRKDIDEGGNRC